MVVLEVMVWRFKAKASVARDVLTHKGTAETELSELHYGIGIRH
jgi:hypothetical protein